MKYILFIFLLIQSHLFAINLQQTRKSHSLTFEKLDDARSRFGHVRNDYNWILSVVGSYVDAPLTIKTGNNNFQIDEVVQGIYGVHIGFGYYLKKWLLLGVDSAYNQFEDNNRDSYSGFSDPQIKARFRFYNKNNLALAIAPFVNLDIDDGGEFTIANTASSRVNGIRFDALSDQGIGWGANLIGEYVFNKMQFVVNLGYQNSSNAISIDNTGVSQIDYRESLLTGIGAYIPFGRKWGINLELLRQWTFDLFNNDQERNEFFVGAAGGITENLHGYAGVGFGNLFQGSDGNDYRLSLGLKLIGGEKYKKKPLKALFVQDKKCYEYFVIRFPTNESTVYSKGNSELTGYLKTLKNKESLIDRVEVVGHTSLAGSIKYNEALALRRSANVEKLLVHYGISQSKIHSSGLGEVIPLHSDDNDEKSLGAVENRRVEVKIQSRSCRF